MTLPTPIPCVCGLYQPPFHMSVDSTNPHSTCLWTLPTPIPLICGLYQPPFHVSVDSTNPHTMCLWTLPTSIPHVCGFYQPPYHVSVDFTNTNTPCLCVLQRTLYFTIPHTTCLCATWHCTWLNSTPLVCIPQRCDWSFPHQIIHEFIILLWYGALILLGSPNQGNNNVLSAQVCTAQWLSHVMTSQIRAIMFYQPRYVLPKDCHMLWHHKSGQ